MPAARKTPLFSPRRAAAFTLLEVLIAVAIFAVCVTALYNGFRVSTRAFAAGRQSAETLQTLRFVMDQLTRDLRGIRFDQDYQRQFRAIEAKILSNQEQIIRDQRAGNPVRLPGIIEVPAEEGKGTYVGLRANFRFLGENKEKTDSIEFTRRMPSEGDFDDAFLGAERVRYFVWNNNLYRRRSKAFEVMQLNPTLWQDLVAAREAMEAARDTARDTNLPFLDYYRLQTQGPLPPQVEPPYPIKFFEPAPVEPQPPELIARNVVEFDLSYGLYNAQEWGEVETWDSDSKQHRTPEFQIPLNDPIFSERLADYQNRNTDNLPSYVRIRVKVDPKLGERGTSKAREARAFDAETSVWIPAALETYSPRDENLFEPTLLEDASGSGGNNPGGVRP